MEAYPSNIYTYSTLPGKRSSRLGYLFIVHTAVYVTPMAKLSFWLHLHEVQNFLVHYAVTSFVLSKIFELTLVYFTDRLMLDKLTPSHLQREKQVTKTPMKVWLTVLVIYHYMFEVDKEKMKLNEPGRHLKLNQEL